MIQEGNFTELPSTDKEGRRAERRGGVERQFFFICEVPG